MSFHICLLEHYISHYNSEHYPKALNRTDSLSLLDLGGGCGATSYDVATFSKFKNKSVTLRDICLPYLVLSQQLFNANTDISFHAHVG